MLDPIVEVRPTTNQIDDLMDEIQKRVELDERVLVTTLTKRMAEELYKYFSRFGVRCRYIHSDVDTLERVEILRDLRMGLFDVLIGVNLLREGLDLPEVSLVAILDADKEGFLRNERSLVQTIGRAARHPNGMAILYADTITDSMQRTIDETNRRRAVQSEYNSKHGITPKILQKSLDTHLPVASRQNLAAEPMENFLISEPETPYLQSPETLKKQIEKTRKEMEQAAKALDFIKAAQLRDQMLSLEAKYKELYSL
jgi:excinuclease ABC subunit B